MTTDMIETMWSHYNNELYKLRRSGFFCGSHYDFVRNCLAYYEKLYEERIPFLLLAQQLPLNNTKK